jgi:trigger factor
VNVTVESLAPCKKLMRVEIEAQKVDETFEAVTKDFRREAKLPGFRPGKAPREMVLRKYEKDIQDETKRKLISEAYRKAVEEQKLDVLGQPDIEEIQFSRGQPLQFAATIETAPEFELPEYKGLPIQRELRSVTEADVERALNLLREQRVSFQEGRTPLQSRRHRGGQLHRHLRGQADYEIAPTAKGLTEQKNFWVEATPRFFHPRLCRPAHGRQGRRQADGDVDFPADFVTPQLAGKKGSYEVEVVR